MKTVIVSRKADIRLLDRNINIHFTLLFYFFVIASSCYPLYILSASFLCHLILIIFVSWDSRLQEFQK